MARKRVVRKANKNSKGDKLAKTFLIIGLSLFLIGTFSHFKIIANSYFSQKEKPTFEVNAQNPRMISIPAVGIGIGVAEGGILNGSWILSDFEALYLPTSGKVGEGYNTIIYAHNRQGLFQGLDKLHENDTIFVRDNSGREFSYRVYEIKKIDPKDIEALYTKEKDVLTLFTCSGWFDEERLLVRAKIIPSTIQE